MVSIGKCRRGQLNVNQERVLKIYSDSAYLPDSAWHTIILYPFWGECPGSLEGVDTGRFDEYITSGAGFITLVPDLDQADVAVLPFEWKAKKQWGKDYDTYLQMAVAFENKALRSGKRIVVFFNNDSDEPIPLRNPIIFRTSFYRSTRKANEFAFPGWSIDFQQKYRAGKHTLRKKTAVPTVCYTGYVDYDADDRGSVFLHHLKLLARWKPPIERTLRGVAVRTLKQEPGVKMNFIRRKGFSGGCDEATRQEYLSNMIESDYSLVIRGAGNFSYRLYEVMSCGRIPVLIDTDCVLPFDGILDWKRYCVWVDSSEVERLGEKIREFHERISAAEFEELQISIRRLYEDWICPAGFFRNIWRNILSL